MGCHTWFYRPVTKEEFEFFKSNAINDAWNLYGDNEINKLFDTVDITEFLKIKKSVEEDTDYWWKREIGVRLWDDINDKAESVYIYNNTMYLDLSYNPSPIFKNIKRYHDVFRVKNYPRKIIHNKRELRRYLRKKYFELEKWQLDKITEFFRENPKGIIMFG